MNIKNIYEFCFALKYNGGMSDKNVRNQEYDESDYELLPCQNQKLTFNILEDEFAYRHIVLDDEKIKKFNLKQDGLYTNFAYWLSDQCQTIIEVVVEENGASKENIVMTGSILKQLTDAYRYVEHYIHDNGFKQLDDYKMVLREVFVNAMVHRSYEQTYPTYIILAKDKITCVSYGGIVHNIGIDNILCGLSITRNINLAEIFYQLELTETCGTGIQKVLRAYQRKGGQPRFHVLPYMFCVEMPVFKEEKKEC